MKLLKDTLKVTSHTFLGCLMFWIGNEAAKPKNADLWIIFGICVIGFVVSLVIALIGAYAD